MLLLAYTSRYSPVALLACPTRAHEKHGKRGVKGLSASVDVRGINSRTTNERTKETHGENKARVSEKVRCEMKREAYASAWVCGCVCARERNASGRNEEREKQNNKKTKRNED
ncbi:hypothetical protein BDY24DRAFT_99509 [Mrakia frigida]|uniref:uncharacterized protein n=1 Tax=Mrakia frigida TaxID=29902 RepID=UPI003FCC1BD2